MRLGGLIAAIVVSAIAAVLVLRMSAPEPAPVTAQPTAAAPQVKTVNVYVASQPIPIGTRVTEQMVSVQPWPEHLVLEGFVRADAVNKDDKTQGVVGTIARAPFQAQEPLIKAKLANPNDPNFIAGALPKGMRLITIQTNETEGLAGFIFPGDHVDVLLTHEVEKTRIVRTSSASTDEKGMVHPQSSTSEQQYKEPVTETLLNNVLVVAVDQRSSSEGAVGPDGKLAIPRSVSLMVSPSDAQRMRLGQSMGTITLSLRSLEDRDAADPATIIAPSDVSQFKTGPAGELNTESGVRVYRGAESQ